MVYKTQIYFYSQNINDIRKFPTRIHYFTNYKFGQNFIRNFLRRKHFDTNERPQHNWSSEICEQIKSP